MRPSSIIFCAAIVLASCAHAADSTPAPPATSVAATTTAAVTNTTSECEVAVEFRYTFYKISTNERVNNVVRRCEETGGWLATIPNAATEKEVLKAIIEDGEHTPHSNGEVYIGLVKCPDTGDWYWGFGPMKGCRVSNNEGSCQSGAFCEWGGGGPDNNERGETWGTIYKSDGSWNDNYDYNEGDIAGYVCQVPTCKYYSRGLFDGAWGKESCPVRKDLNATTCGAAGPVVSALSTCLVMMLLAVM